MAGYSLAFYEDDRKSIHIEGRQYLLEPEYTEQELNQMEKEGKELRQKELSCKTTELKKQAVFLWSLLFVIKNGICL